MAKIITYPSIRNHPKTTADTEINYKTQNELLPANILRIEKMYQKKPAARDAIGKFIPKGKHNGIYDELYVEDAFHNNLCKEALTDMTNRMGDVFDLIVADLGCQPQFLPIEYAWQTAERLGLVGHDKAFFSNYSLAVAQMGCKNANVLYDDTFGREGQKNRSKYHNLINQKLGGINLCGFFLCDLFEEIRTQIKDFRPYKTDEEANKVLKEAEERQKQRRLKANPVISPRRSKKEQTAHGQLKKTSTAQVATNQLTLL